MTPRIVDKEAKRKAIVHAALPVLAQRGVHAFRMIEVAHEAGVGKGTLYEYFASKEALIQATFSQLLADYAESVATAVEEAGDPISQIKKLLTVSCQFFAAEKARLELLLDLWAACSRQQQGHSFLDPIDPLYRKLRAWLAAILRNGIRQGQLRKVNARLTASLILALIDGILFQAALGIIDPADTKTVRALTQTILKGIAV